MTGRAWARAVGPDRRSATAAGARLASRSASWGYPSSPVDACTEFDDHRAALFDGRRHQL